MTKSVLDLANLLDVLIDPSKTTIPEGGYKGAVTGSWDGIRVGMVEPEEWLFPREIVKYEKDVVEQMVGDITLSLLGMTNGDIATRLEFSIWTTRILS